MLTITYMNENNSTHVSIFKEAFYYMHGDTLGHIVRVHTSTPGPVSDQCSLFTVVAPSRAARERILKY